MKKLLSTATVAQLIAFLNTYLFDSLKNGTNQEKLFFIGFSETNLLHKTPHVGASAAIFSLTKLIEAGVPQDTVLSLYAEDIEHSKVSNKEVTITISGPSNSGKSIMSAAIYKGLLTLGFSDTKWIDDELPGEVKMDILNEVSSYPSSRIADFAKDISVSIITEQKTRQGI